MKKNSSYLMFWVTRVYLSIGTFLVFCSVGSNICHIHSKTSYRIVCCRSWPEWWCQGKYHTLWWRRCRYVVQKWRLTHA